MAHITLEPQGVFADVSALRLQKIGRSPGQGLPVWTHRKP